MNKFFMNMLEILQYLYTVTASENLAKTNTRHSYDDLKSLEPYAYIYNLPETGSANDTNHFGSIINYDA